MDRGVCQKLPVRPSQRPMWKERSHAGKDRKEKPVYWWDEGEKWVKQTKVPTKIMHETVGSLLAKMRQERRFSSFVHVKNRSYQASEKK